MNAGSPVIVGIDEAGRGPLAGPVVAAACHIPVPLLKLDTSYGAWVPTDSANDCLIADSKQLTPAQRDTAYAWIMSHCVVGIGMADQTYIDTAGILTATEYSMQQALTSIAATITPTYLLVDGRDKFWFDYPHSSIIHGDDLEPTIAAASIVAKVTRDRWMTEASHRFPQYGFEEHKGYGSAKHIETLRKIGPCALHRITYLRSIVTPVVAH